MLELDKQQLLMLQNLGISDLSFLETNKIDTKLFDLMDASVKS